MLRLIAGPYIGWTLGFRLLPSMLQNSVGIALYGMFISIVVPTAKESKAALAIIAIAISSIFIRSFLYYMPYAMLGAMTFPYILYSIGNILVLVVGGLVALFLAYNNQGMMRVILGSTLAVYICQRFFRRCV